MGVWGRVGGIQKVCFNGYLFLEKHYSRIIIRTDHICLILKASKCRKQNLFHKSSKKCCIQAIAYRKFDSQRANSVAAHHELPILDLGCLQIQLQHFEGIPLKVAKIQSILAALKATWLRTLSDIILFHIQ